ncbi:MAG: NPCBM/NEW2 domain-containing protein [Sedimentisphaerales bacterium]|nr:NPCBM/NEW2 domain-containing protein [Sedimentisphaerales bacterium]MBN2842718.1 NPCBM/NEW2 domain-containing protein [Sedimentisphaerales bacterium]
MKRLTEFIFILFVMLVSQGGSGLFAGQWHCPSAQLAFTLEPDHNKSVNPDIHLADVRLVNPDSSNNLSFGPQPGKAHYKTLNGRISSYYMAVKGSGLAVYRCNGRYQRFTALVGLADNSSDSARVRLEIWTESEKIFTSPQIGKYARPVEINIAIPLEARKLKLITVVSGDDNSEVIWSAPGFLELGKNPQSSLADLYVPETIGPVQQIKVLTGTGMEVNSQIVSNPVRGPLRIIFDSSSGSELYYAYMTTDLNETVLTPGNLWELPAGLALETRILTQDTQRVSTHPGFMEAWSATARKVDFRPVDAIHASFPPALLWQGDALISRQKEKDCLGLYTYKGWFNIRQAGEYDFATASNWGSTIFIDDRFVVHWPDRHDFHAGRRCEYSGKVWLEPGIHKLEYMNYNQWGRQYTMCAWRFADGVYRIMTAPDFLSWGYYRPVSLATIDSTPAGSFSWQVTDDLRSDHANSPALVAVAFKVIPPAGQDNDQLEYCWEMADGLVARGAQIEHVYLARGEYEVTLTATAAGNTVFNARQKVSADIDTGKLRCEPRNKRIFDNALDTVFLAHADINSLKGLFDLAAELQMNELQAAVAGIICSRPATSHDFSADPAFYYELAQYLSAITANKTHMAIALLAVMLSSDSPSKWYIDARLHYVRLLIDHAGDYALAQQELQRLKGNMSLTQVIRRKILQAEIELGCGRTVAEADYFSMPAGSAADENMRQQELTAILRRAKLIVQGSDPELIAKSYNELNDALDKSPAWLFTSDYNLTRLSLLQAAGAALRQANVAGRCMALSASDTIMPQLLYLRAQAFLALDQTEPARNIWKQMQEQYPYCSETARLATELKE